MPKSVPKDEISSPSSFLQTPPDTFGCRKIIVISYNLLASWSMISMMMCDIYLVLTIRLRGYDMYTKESCNDLDRIQ